MIQPVNNTPSFKGYNIIQLPRKAFAQPNNFRAVEDEFTRICDKALKMPKPWMLSVASFFGKIIMPRIDYFLEAPLYSDLLDDLEKLGGYSLEWLQLHSGATIKPPKRDGYHSFVVLTGDDQERFRDLIVDYALQGKSDTLLSCMQQRANEGAVLDEISASATVYEKFSEDFDNEFRELSPVFHELTSLSEVPNLIKSLHEAEP